VAEVGELGADLAAAAGDELELDERGVLVALEDAVAVIASRPRSASRVGGCGASDLGQP